MAFLEGQESFLLYKLTGLEKVRWQLWKGPGQPSAGVEKEAGDPLGSGQETSEPATASDKGKETEALRE